MALRIDTHWNGIACNVVSQDLETICKVANKLDRIGVEYTILPSNDPVNDRTGLVEMILAEPV